MDAFWHALLTFISFPKSANIWAALNAPITVSVAAAVFAWFLKDRVEEYIKTKDEINRRETGSAAEDTVGSAEAVGALELEDAVGETVDFAEAAPVMQDLKGIIDGYASAATDGRKRRKYSNFTRYDYIPLIEVLQDDKQLRPELAARFLEIFQSWKPYRSGRLRRVPAILYREMQGLKELARRS